MSQKMSDRLLRGHMQGGMSCDADCYHLGLPLSASGNPIFASLQRKALSLRDRLIFDMIIELDYLCYLRMSIQ